MKSKVFIIGNCDRLASLETNGGQSHVFHSRTNLNDAFEGAAGSFNRLKGNKRKRYKNSHIRSHNKRMCGSIDVERNKDINDENKKSGGRFRFVVCSLALSAMSLSLMSRTIFNIAIIEMTKQFQGTMNKEQQNLTKIVSFTTEKYSNNSIDEENGSGQIYWSAYSQNLLIGAFYIGYAPSILLNNCLTNDFGSKYPLLICILGSSLISLLTPFLAKLSLTLLIIMRSFLGLIQGSILYPSCYELFNKWQTDEDISLFVPLIKVSCAFGSLVGAMLPGLIVALNIEWPFIFYCSSFICALWCVIWLPLASSMPKLSRFVSIEELNLINRNKKNYQKQATNKKINNNSVIVNDLVEVVPSTGNEQQSKSYAINLLLIIKNPSVIALTIVKFTYNIGMDFVALESAFYMKNIYQAPTEIISALASGGCLLQMFLITYVDWTANKLVRDKTFGLSCTKWRKLFQGLANFSIAIIYLILSLASNNGLCLVTSLFYMIYLAWMMGIGGEAMVPYDLSPDHPDTIVDLAQSVSVLSGLAVPILSGFILDNQMDDPNRWNILFLIISISAFFGGLIFILFYKAKPFFPGESKIKCNKQILTRNKSNSKIVKLETSPP